MPVRGYPTVNGQLGGRSRPRGPGRPAGLWHLRTQAVSELPCALIVVPEYTLVAATQQHVLKLWRLVPSLAVKNVEKLATA